jgi:hypothetical protein
VSELAFGLASEVRTTDVDEAAAAFGRVYVAAELTPIDTKSVNMRMNALQLPLLTAGYLGSAPTSLSGQTTRSGPLIQ